MFYELFETLYSSKDNCSSTRKLEKSKNYADVSTFSNILLEGLQ